MPDRCPSRLCDNYNGELWAAILDWIYTRFPSFSSPFLPPFLAPIALLYRAPSSSFLLNRCSRFAPDPISPRFFVLSARERNKRGGGGKEERIRNLPSKSKNDLKSSRIRRIRRTRKRNANTNSVRSEALLRAYARYHYHALINIQAAILIIIKQYRRNCDLLRVIISYRLDRDPLIPAGIRTNERTISLSLSLSFSFSFFRFLFALLFSSYSIGSSSNEKSKRNEVCDLEVKQVENSVPSKRFTILSTRRNSNFAKFAAKGNEIRVYSVESSNQSNYRY